MRILPVLIVAASALSLAACEPPSADVGNNTDQSDIAAGNTTSDNGNLETGVTIAGRAVAKYCAPDSFEKDSVLVAAGGKDAGAPSLEEMGEQKGRDRGEDGYICTTLKEDDGKGRVLVTTQSAELVGVVGQAADAADIKVVLAAEGVGDCTGKCGGTWACLVGCVIDRIWPPVDEKQEVQPSGG